MHRRRSPLIVVVVALVLAVVPGIATADEAPEPPSDPCADGPAWSDYTRPAEHDTVTLANLPIEMSDGVTLYADVTLPDADGPFPAIVTQTAYSKDVLGGTGSFAPRGYAEVVVDLRGTGTSEGGWDPFSERERRDGFEVFEWVVDQPWSDGVTGGYGASYLGLTQIFSAAQQPAGLAAIFPVVPVADAYRDIVFMGGQANALFMPPWVALVTALSVAPNSRFADDPAGAVATAIEHVLRLAEAESTPALLLRALTGDEEVRYDGAFWQDRSPINHVDGVEVPTFLVGGLDDLFQRGTPLLYEALADRVDTKLLVGPWGHIAGSSGEGLAEAGLPALEDLALRWFDHHLRGIDTAVECIPDVTQWHWGAEEYRTQPDWPHPELTPQPWYLGDGTLSSTPPPATGSELLPPVPIAGTCSRSADQWLMGALAATPCAQDNRLNELLEAQWTSPPLDDDLTINGPIGARLWLETTGPEAVVVVRVTDVAPDGTSRELTNGLQVASFRGADEARSRIVDGWNLQPWHPYTAESVTPMPVGEATPVDVEIFPTAAVLPAGHRLRVSIGAADVPHAISPLPDLVASVATATRVVHGPDTPSWVVVPEVPSAGTQPVLAAPAPTDTDGPGSTDGAGDADDASASDGDLDRDGHDLSGEVEAQPTSAPLPVTGSSGGLAIALLVAAATLRRRVSA